MRSLSVILLLVAFTSQLSAQQDRPRNLPAFDYKRLHWGFTVGLNSMDFAIDRNPDAANFLYADVQGFQPAGFQVNIVSDLRLNESFTLRFLPGINLGSRNVIYFDPNNNWTEVPIPAKPSDASNRYIMTIGSSFLDFPLLLKYRSERVNNYRPYVVGGISYRLDMSAKSNFDPDGDDMFLLKKSDFYLELGFGVDNYLKYFKYSTEIKLAMGLRNVLNDTQVRDSEAEFLYSLNGLRSFLVMLNFHFE